MKTVKLELTLPQANAILLALTLSDVHPGNDGDGCYQEHHATLRRAESKLIRAVVEAEAVGGRSDA